MDPHFGGGSGGLIYVLIGIGGSENMESSSDGIICGDESLSVGVTINVQTEGVSILIENVNLGLM